MLCLFLIQISASEMTSDAATGCLGRAKQHFGDWSIVFSKATLDLASDPKQREEYY
jgi:hypothetical protein